MDINHFMIVAPTKAFCFHYRTTVSLCDISDRVYPPGLFFFFSTLFSALHDTILRTYLHCRTIQTDSLLRNKSSTHSERWNSKSQNNGPCCRDSLDDVIKLGPRVPCWV